MKIKYKHRSSTISTISTQRKINSHLKTLNIKRQGHILLEIQILSWDRQNNVAGFYQLMGPQPPPLDNWVSNGNTDVNKQ